MNEDIGARKRDHIEVVAQGRGRQDSMATGFDRVRFLHEALPDLDMDRIDCGCVFLGRPMRAPLLVSAMTGGPPEAGRINAAIAEAAQAAGVAMSVGSQRIALEGRGAAGLDAGLRRLAPDIPILANLGAVQLNHGIGPDQARRAVEMIGADALMLHLNPLQEAIQPGGDRDFAGLLPRIEALARVLPVPLGVKEVGCGISAATARRLVDAGAGIIDVAGVGGTSWARVEAERSHDPDLAAIALPFHDWGIPTAQALPAVAAAVGGRAAVIASGGIRHGLDVARAIRLGAVLAGQAGPVLRAAATSAEAVGRHLEALAHGLRIAMFCTGSATLDELRRAPLMPME